MKLTHLSSVSLAVLLLLTHAAVAENINGKIPSSVLAEYCATQAEGSETRAQFTGTDGNVISGEVECEAEDIVAGTDAANGKVLSVDALTAGAGDSDDDLNDDSGSDDDSEDDNSGSGGDDDSGDDGDDHGGDDD